MHHYQAMSGMSLIIFKYFYPVLTLHFFPISSNLSTWIFLEIPWILLQLYLFFKKILLAILTYQWICPEKLNVAVDSCGKLLYKKKFYSILSLKNLKILRKYWASNAWAAIFKNANFFKSSLKVTKLSKF